MIDVCQWRARVGLFNASRGHCRPFATVNPFVGLDPLLHCLLAAIASLAGLVLSVIGALGTTTTATTTAEGKRVIKGFQTRITEWRWSIFPLFVVLAKDDGQGGVRCQLRLVCAKRSLRSEAIKRCGALRLCLVLVACSCLIGGFLLVRLLLLMAGDVESNPGPNGKTSGIVIFFTVE